MTTYIQNWDGGTGAADGVAITASNTNGSGNTAIVTPTATGAATATFSATAPKSGSLSAQWTIPAGGSLASATPLPTSGTFGTRFAYREYLYLTANPGSSALVSQARSATKNIFLVAIESDGTLTLRNAGNTIIWTSASPLPLSQWVRVEVAATQGATNTGTVEIAYYLGDSLLAAGGSGVLSGVNTSSSTTGVDTFQFGTTGAITSGATYLRDDWALNTALASGFIGPSPVSRRAAGTVAANTTAATTISPAWPANQVGDVALMFVSAAASPVTTPAGWTAVGVSTAAAGAKVYAFFQSITTVQTGTVAVTTPSTTSRAVILTYTGASNSTPVFTALGQNTASASLVSGSITTSGFAVWGISLASSVTVSAEASASGGWVPTEVTDSSGTPSLLVADGPIATGTTTTFSGTASASTTYGSIVVTLANSVAVTVAFSGSGSLFKASSTLNASPRPAFPGTGRLAKSSSLVKTSRTGAFTGTGVFARKTAIPGWVRAALVSGSGVLTATGKALYGAAATSPGSSLEFRVTHYATANKTTYDEVLNGFVDGTWMDEMNGPGSGYVILSTQHPKILADPTLLDQRNWITVLLNGAIVGRFLLQTKELVLANQNANGDMADRVWTISGEGLRTLLHDAVVFPENGKVDKTTSDTRYFNFATVTKSRWYNSSQWTAPFVGPKFLQKNSYFLKYPAGFPIPSAHWIWGTQPNSTNGYAPVGYNYFRGEFSVPASGYTFSFYAAGDDGMNLFLDGSPIAATAIHQSSFANVVSVEGIALDPGTHVLSAQVYNMRGRAGFIACVRQDANDAANTAVKTLTYTGDGNWKACAYPSQEPGWTIGEVMLQLWNEAKNRGVDFPNQLTPDFSADYDSAGVAWPSTGSFSFGINSDYFSVLSTLESLGVDAYVDPVTLKFHIYNQQGVDYSNVTAYPNPPTLLLGKNVTTSDEVSVAAVKNGLLVQTNDGWVWKTDTNSLSKFGRIEGGAQTSVNSNQANTIINKTFQLLSTPNVSTTYQVIDSTNLVPGGDFHVGDWIMAPSMNTTPNTLTKRRVMSITYAVDTQNYNPNVVYAIELDTIYQDRITNLTQLIAKLSNTDAVTGAATARSTPTTGSGAPVSAGSSDHSNRAAYPPTNFAVGTIIGTYDSKGAPTCALALSWVAPVDSEGNTQDISFYEVYGSTPTVGWAVLARVEGNNLTTTVNVTPNQSWTLGVRACPSWNTSLFSDFSNQITVTSVKPGLPPDAPSTPTLSTDKGTITAHWDGNLVNSGGASYTPPVQFTSVTTYIYSLPDKSDIRQVSGLLQGAGSVVITGLAVGTLYNVLFYANDSAGLTSTQSPEASITVQGIIGPDISANTVTANNLAVGAITADKLDVGTVAQGNAVNRVPMPMSQNSFWSLVINNNAPNLGGDSNATATTTGVKLTPTTTGEAYCYVAAKTRVPDSAKIFVTMSSSASIAYPAVKWYDAAGVTTVVNLAASSAGVAYVFPPTAVSYAVKVTSPAVASPVSDTVTFIQIFESIGTGLGTGQSAELSPDGFRLYSGENSNPVLTLSSSSADTITLSDSSGQQVASIDSAGNGAFSTVNAGPGSTFDGIPLIFDPSDPDFAYTLSESNPNGNSWTRGDVTLGDGSAGQVALLDRLGRGVIYDVTWPSQQGTSVTTQYRRIAQDRFVLEDGRSYQFVLDLGGLQTDNGSGVNAYVELQVKTGAPFTSVIDGTVIGRAVVYNGTKGYWSIPPITFSASTNQSSVDPVNRSLPANTPIYWQINTNLSSTPTTAYVFSEFGNTRGLTVIDVGSAYPTRPNNGADSLADTHDYSTSGGSSGSTSGGTTATSKTVQATATWSRSWNQSGSNIVTDGGTQWTNSKALYQGNGVTPMGARWGFSSSFLSQFQGKTVTSAYIYLKNAYQAYSGSSALLETHGATSAPSTISGRGSNPFSKSFSAGQGQWISLNSTIRSGLSSGAVTGFGVGVDGSNSNYMYFEGVGYGSHPPQLKVTFH